LVYYCGNNWRAPQTFLDLGEDRAMEGIGLATCRLEIVEGNDRVVAVGLATYALQAI